MVQWLRMQVLGMVVPGSNCGKAFFSTFFAHLFYPIVNVLLEYLDSTILHLLGFLLQLCCCNSIAIQTIKRHCCDDQPIYTPISKLFLYSVYPVAMTEV